MVCSSWMLQMQTLTHRVGSIRLLPVQRRSVLMTKLNNGGTFTVSLVQTMVISVMPPLQQGGAGHRAVALCFGWCRSESLHSACSRVAALPQLAWSSRTVTSFSLSARRSHRQMEPNWNMTLVGCKARFCLWSSTKGIVASPVLLLICEDLILLKHSQHSPSGIHRHRHVPLCVHWTTR